ncbi:MAG: hypothetical protein JSV41_09795 [Gemmatimonadota bacterium]|nr:MAG: hypothetical protein JSV41_09795 [Gemmatimonadota bacterium]
MSGLRTAPADRAHGPIRTALPILVIAAVTAATACVYFNAYYNASRLFDQGRREIEEGRESGGRMTLGMSIEKAERIVERSPNSRWADEALRLIVQARLLREEWGEAAEASGSLLRYVRSRRDSAEVAGYRGTAELHLDHPALADSLLTFALSGEDDQRRRAAALSARAQARVQLGRPEAADADLRAASALRPAWLAPRLLRVRLLLDGGGGFEAARELAGLLEFNLNDSQQQDVMQTTERLREGDPGTGLEALSAVESSRFSRANRAQLLQLRGDLRIAAGDVEMGRGDYRLATETDPGSAGAMKARLALLRLDLRYAATAEDFHQLKAEIDRIQRFPAGRTSADVRDLAAILIRVEYWLGVGNLGYLLAAETARDEFEAEALARHLFLKFVEEQSESLWAPKAILAVLALTPLDSGAGGDQAENEPSAEELRRRLLEDYSDSSYVQALLGGPPGRFTFEELELGLRRQLMRLKTLADEEVRSRQTRRRDR